MRGVKRCLSFRVTRRVSGCCSVNKRPWNDVRRSSLVNHHRLVSFSSPWILLDKKLNSSSTLSSGGIIPDDGDRFSTERLGKGDIVPDDLVVRPSYNKPEGGSLIPGFPGPNDLAGFPSVRRESALDIPRGNVEKIIPFTQERTQGLLLPLIIASFILLLWLSDNARERFCNAANRAIASKFIVERTEFYQEMSKRKKMEGFKLDDVGSKAAIVAGITSDAIIIRSVAKSIARVTNFLPRQFFLMLWTFKEFLLSPFGGSSPGRLLNDTRMVSELGPYYEPWSALMMNGLPVAFWVATEIPYVVFSRIIFPTFKINSPGVTRLLVGLTNGAKVGLGLAFAQAAWDGLNERQNWIDKLARAKMVQLDRYFPEQIEEKHSYDPWPTTAERQEAVQKEMEKISDLPVVARRV